MACIYGVEQPCNECRICVSVKNGSKVTSRQAEKKLSEELRHCSETEYCGDCQYHTHETTLTCPKLLQKAYEVVKQYEEMFPCWIGDTVYELQEIRHRIQPLEIISINIGRMGEPYFNWELKDGIGIYQNIKGFGMNQLGKTVFLTREQAEQALKEMEDILKAKKIEVKTKQERCRFCHQFMGKNHDESHCVVDGWEYDKVKIVSKEQCEQCEKFDSKFIEYPLTIQGIDNAEIDNSGLGNECGALCEISPCGKEYEGKSYIGIYLGDLPIAITTSYHRENGILENRTMNNPAIFVPELKKIIYGCESWWREIETIEDFKGISKEDIENTWYVKLLKIIEDSNECGMCPAAGKRNSKVTSKQGIDAEKLSRFIANFIFAEKEIVLEALKNEDEQMLEDEVYEYIQNCN